MLAATACEEKVQQRPPAGEALVLCLHDVGGAGRYSLSIAQLISLFELLKKSYRVVSLKDWYSQPQTDRKTVILTFDDGFNSVHELVVPLLKKYNFGATFFIYLERHRDDSPFFKKIQKWPPEYEVGSHAFSHVNLVRLAHLNRRRLFKQLYLSRQKLEFLTRREVSSFSWPYGIYKEELVQSVFEAGYQLQVSTDYARARRYERIYGRFTLTQPDPVQQARKYLARHLP